MHRAAVRLKSAIVAVLLAGLLSACGSGGGDTPADPPSGGSTPVTPLPPPPTGSVPTPPTQPTSGPGGSDYAYPLLSTNTYGLGAAAYTLVIPQGAGRTRLPVVYLLHGYGSLDLSPYVSFAEHLAMRGAIVIYPLYEIALTPFNQYLDNAVQNIRDALQRLADDGSGPIADTTRVIAIGHSLGGGVATYLTTSAASLGIPQPRALIAMNPADQSSEGEVSFDVGDLRQIPRGTLLLAMYSDQDTRVPDTLAKQIFTGSTSVPLADKDYIVVNSDSYGTQPLVADHLAALAGRSTAGSLYPPDALDFYGYWKLTDALMSAAFTGQQRETALGGGAPIQAFMGYWGDGRPVTPLTVTDTP